MSWALILSQVVGFVKKIDPKVWIVIGLCFAAWVMGFRRGNIRGYRVGVRHARIECRQNGGRIPINPDDIPPLVRPRPLRPWTWRIWYPRPDKFSITDEELKTDKIMEMMPQSTLQNNDDLESTNWYK